MVYERKFITDIAGVIESKAPELGLTVARPISTVKRFLAKLMTHVTKDILLKMYPELSRPAELWIVGLKAILPLYWHVIERIPKEKIAEWVLDYLKNGVLPKEAIETVESEVIKLLKTAPRELENILPKEKFVKFQEGIKTLLTVADALGYKLSPEFAELVSYYSIGRVAKATA